MVHVGNSLTQGWEFPGMIVSTVGICLHAASVSIVIAFSVITWRGWHGHPLPLGDHAAVRSPWSRNGKA